MIAFLRLKYLVFAAVLLIISSLVWMDVFSVKVRDVYKKPSSLTIFNIYNYQIN
jgi:hypothetical protein